jgi:hypothetical protein
VGVSKGSIGKRGAKKYVTECERAVQKMHCWDHFDLQSLFDISSVSNNTETNFCSASKLIRELGEVQY